jgi:hypothetical protein
MDLESLKSCTQLATQAVAILGVFLYLAGFLTVSLHNASLGISQFNLLRPRIFEAGILFLVFMGLPVLQVARVYGLWGFGPAPKNQPFHMKDRQAGFVCVCSSFLVFLTAAIAASFFIRPFLIYDRLSGA